MKSTDPGTDVSKHLAPRERGRPRVLGLTGTFVDQRIRDLQSRFLRQDASAVAGLAQLRRGVGKPPGAVVDVLQFTYSPELAQGAVDDTPTTREWAAHVAITLWATQQQSRNKPMHVHGRGLGAALRALAPGSDKDIPDPIQGRFRMISTADTFDEVVYHLRGIAQLLRAGEIGMDYALLADQLVRWQRGDRNAVQLAWGRQFYRQSSTASPADIDSQSTPGSSPDSESEE